MAKQELKKPSSAKGNVTPKKYSASSFEANIERIRVEDESDVEKIFQMGEVLGKGAFGIVREVVHKESKEKLAMKTVTKDKPGSISIQLLEREVEVLKRVNHPNIIRVEAVYETAKKMYIVMELCLGGELSDELKKRTYFKEEEAKAIMRRIVEAVVYMHDNDMVHRDLKLENILLANADPNDFTIKVTDFGLANMKGVPGCEDLMHSKCGTPYYMAPEVLYTKHEYTKLCDVWSLGVIMYALLCGKYPFHSTSPMMLEELILKGELTFSEIEWINVGEGAKALLRNMLCVDTTSRFTARSVLDDPWFTGEKGKKMINALDLMRDMVEADNTTSIVVSSPSDVFLSSSRNSNTATSASTTTTAATPSSPSHTGTKVATSSSANASLQKKHGTPTKKISTGAQRIGTGSGKNNPRTVSSSALTGSNSNSKSSGVQSTSGMTSPSHVTPLSSSSSVGAGSGTGTGGARSRVHTYSSGSKSQVLSPSASGASPKTSAESMHSNSSAKDRKNAISPHRTNTPSRTL